MKVLITGVAGFVGSHLARRLIIDGHEVTGIDNLFTGSRKNLHPDVEFVRWDVCDPFHAQVDQIYHLAAPASPVHYQINPTKTLETILVGTKNALALARECGARLVITSTSEVYGDPLEHPQKETYWGNVSTLSPRGPYEEGKRCAETLAWGWAKQHGTQVRIARLFNTHGPRMNLKDGRVVPNLINQALENEELTVYGDGSQTRSLCYVSDMVDGLVALMNAPLTQSPFLCNLGNPEERTVLQIAREIQRLCGGPDSRVVFKPLPQDDPRRRCPDISRAKAWLGWEPKVGFEEGLRRTVEWFKNGLEVL